MGKADTKSHRKRSHTFTKRQHKSSDISRRNMRLVEELFRQDAATTASIPQPQKAMSASRLAKMLRKGHKTYKVKSFSKRALSMVAENGDPVKQLKELGELVKKHAEYLLRKNETAVTNNEKRIYRNAENAYDIAVSQIKESLDNTVRMIGAQYIAVHGFADIPFYEEGDTPYEEIEKLTEFLGNFQETIQRHAPEMINEYNTIMKQTVTEIMKVINTSLESVGERKANNINALAALFSHL